MIDQHTYQSQHHIRGENAATPEHTGPSLGATGLHGHLLSVLALAGLLLAAAWLLAAPIPAAASPDHQAGPTFPPSARNGEALYQENCAPCHGVTGLGDGPTAAELPQGATALADPAIARLATPADWFQVVKEGRMAQMMPPWKNRLTDEQIWDVTAYALYMQNSDAELAQGETVWGEHCAACHGPAGAGDGAQAAVDGLAMPDLADPTLTAGRSLLDWYTVTSAGQGAMPGFAGALTEEAIWAAVAYARSFTFQPNVAAAAPEGDGQLSGRLLNGTTGQPAQATVTLNIFDNFQPMQPKSAETSADGTFTFTGLPTGAQYAFLVSAEYGDSGFGSDIVRFPEGETTLDVSLQVYDASDAPGEITVSLSQWFVDTQPGALLVVELYRINHESDTVYTGGEEVAPGKNAVLRFPVPAGAMSMGVEGARMGERFILTEDGIVDTEPLAPGAGQIVLHYLLPFDGADAELAHPIAYPVDQLNVLVVDGPEVTTDLQSLGPQTAADQQWNSFGATNLPAGEPVSLRLSDLARAQNTAVVPPGGSDAVIAHNPALLFGLGAAALVAILGVFGAYLLFRPKAPATAEVTPLLAAAPAGVVDPATEKQRLLASIAQLDDLYASGGLDEESYQRARTARKRSLVLIAQAQPVTGNSPTEASAPADEVALETSQSDAIGSEAGSTAEERSER